MPRPPAVDQCRPALRTILSPGPDWWRGPRGPVVRGVLALAVVLLPVAGCADGSVAADATASVTDPVLEPTQLAVDLPEQRSAVGTVTAGSPAQLTGNGPIVLDFGREPEDAVVAELDCSACTGEVVASTPGRESAWGRGTGPLTGSYLIDLFAEESTAHELLIEAEGDWSLRLLSWADLPEVSGEQHGSGAAVVRLSDDAESVRVSWTPAGPEDELSARAVSMSADGPDGAPESLSFGADQAFEQILPLTLPGVVAVDTAGEWTITAVG